MAQDSLFKIRDRRDKGWFYLDNEYLNGYAKIFGAVGTAIYVSLCRHADNTTQKCFPAIDTMADEFGCSPTTIKKYLNLFAKHNIISIKREKDPKTKRRLNNVYTLLDKDCWKKHAHSQQVAMESRSHLATEPQPPGDKSHSQPVANKETHIQLDSYKETNGNMVDVLDRFRLINANYKSFFANTTQREAVKFMLDTYSYKELTMYICLAKFCFNDKFFPNFITPHELKLKWPKVAKFYAGKSSDRRFVSDFSDYFESWEKSRDKTEKVVLEKKIGGRTFSYQLEK